MEKKTKYKKYHLTKAQDAQGNEKINLGFETQGNGVRHSSQLGQCYTTSGETYLTIWVSYKIRSG